MFYLGLVTMKEMSPKQWAKAAGTQNPARGMENSAADPVLALESVQRQSFAFLGLASPHGDFPCPSWFGRLSLWGTSRCLPPFPPQLKLLLS